jgi:hypothetical protein
MKVTVTARHVETLEVKNPAAEGDDYFALRDQLYAAIPDGWKAIGIAVKRPEVIRG